MRGLLLKLSLAIGLLFLALGQPLVALFYLLEYHFVFGPFWLDQQPPLFLYRLIRGGIYSTFQSRVFTVPDVFVSLVPEGIVGPLAGKRVDAFFDGLVLLAQFGVMYRISLLGMVPPAA